MTISNRRSRKITIGQENYRWVVSPSGKGSLVLTVQHDDFNGQLIRVSVESDINEYWIECPNVKSLDMKVIKPADVTTVIIEAMNQGWTPKDKGKPLCFCLSGSTLVPR
ncbi:hypothetical protein FHS15_005781 [Paenibacillus castaneae]|uniref:hypothetical protein n=1 Tax=Paenibacillus castaneae TaxID=474957 RepID=UPI000C9C9E94|nr:hypothetical protein [Paenibacillus castaneae]NIK80590.1 hypothetical protein [Paenibacillus castaneae]